MTTETVEQRAERLVRREVLCCLSSMVSTLACHYGSVEGGDTLLDVMEQAFELASPVQDYEEAAIQAGWTRNIHNGMFVAPVGHDPRMADYESWQELCDEQGLEPYDREVFEHWAVSQWLADKLTAHGEKVDTDFAGLCVWARTCSGQAIAMDSVIQKIAAEVL